MNQHLPTDVLRNFVSVVEHGSMLNASGEVGLTQSALSLQMKKLNELVGTPVFSRHSKGVMLTASGESLLLYARGILEMNDRAFAAIAKDVARLPIRVGFVQDFAALLVSGPISRFRHIYPEMNLRIKVGSTSELRTQFDVGLLDIFVGLGWPEERGVIGSSPVRWLGDPALARNREIPLAVMDDPCPFRDRMIDALERAGRDYRIVLETPGVAVLGAAINAGLALTCRTTTLPFVEDKEWREIDVPVDPLGIILKCDHAAQSYILKLQKMISSYLYDHVLL